MKGGIEIEWGVSVRIEAAGRTKSWVGLAGAILVEAIKRYLKQPTQHTVETVDREKECGTYTAPFGSIFSPTNAESVAAKTRLDPFLGWLGQPNTPISTHASSYTRISTLILATKANQLT